MRLGERVQALLGQRSLEAWSTSMALLILPPAFGLLVLKIIAGGDPVPDDILTVGVTAITYLFAGAVGV